MVRLLIAIVILAFCAERAPAQGLSGSSPPPVPLIQQGASADWIFAYKFNASSFPNMPAEGTPACLLGGSYQTGQRISEHYVYATNLHPALQQGLGFLGTTVNDPLGATFSEIYKGDYFYIVWNDQFQGSPIKNGGAGTGHSKGVLAWNGKGEGLILQVSTPGWPGSGSSKYPRAEGNSLGCLSAKISNNLNFAQHFFALRLSPDDVVAVIQALANARIVTNPIDPTDPTKSVKENAIWRIGGPAAITRAADQIRTPKGGPNVTDARLSSGIRLISKSPDLHVPPWQLVSAELGGPALRVATWTGSPMHSTSGNVGCWGLQMSSGAITIAKNGSWLKTPFKLTQSSSHAKIGVSVSGPPYYTIFSDLNEQGSLDPTPKDPKCQSSQNARGGLFFVLSDPTLHASICDLIAEPDQPQAAGSRGTPVATVPAVIEAERCEAAH